MKMAALETGEDESAIQANVLDLCKDLASSQKDYSAHGWKSDSFGVIKQEMVEALLHETKFNLVHIFDQLEKPDTGVSILRQMTRIFMSHIRSFQDQPETTDDDEPPAKKVKAGLDPQKRKLFEKGYAAVSLLAPGVLNQQQALSIVSDTVVAAQTESIGNMPHEVFYEKLKQNELHPLLVVFLLCGSSTSGLYLSFDNLTTRRNDVLQSVADDVSVLHHGNITKIGQHTCWALAVQACVLNLLNKLDWKWLLTSTEDSIYPGDPREQSDMKKATDFKTDVVNGFGETYELQYGSVCLLKNLSLVVRPWDKSLHQVMGRSVLPEIIIPASALKGEGASSMIAAQACSHMTLLASVDSSELSQIVSTLVKTRAPQYHSFSQDGDNWRNGDVLTTMTVDWPVRVHQCKALTERLNSLKNRIELLRNARDNRIAAGQGQSQRGLYPTKPSRFTGITSGPPGGNAQPGPQSDGKQQQSKAEFRKTHQLLFPKDGLVPLNLFERNGNYAFKLTQHDLSEGNKTKLENEMLAVQKMDKRTAHPSQGGPICLQGFFIPSDSQCTCNLRHLSGPRWDKDQRQRFLTTLFPRGRPGFFITAKGKVAITTR